MNTLTVRISIYWPVLLISNSLSTSFMALVANDLAPEYSYKDYLLYHYHFNTPVYTLNPTVRL